MPDLSCRFRWSLQHFSNRLVQWGFSRSTHLRLLYLIRPPQGSLFVDLSLVDEFSL